MTEQAKKKIENVYKYSSNSIEKIEAAKFGYAIASQEHREEVERLKAREKELWIVLGEVLSEFDKTGTIPKGMYEEAKEIYKLPTHQQNNPPLPGKAGKK